MLAAVQNLIPVLNSKAGLCLTPENWKDAKVTTVSYSLEFLLYKPGQEVLKKIADISQYLAWTGAIVLNGMSLGLNKEGIYLLKSPYDGSKIRLTSLELIKLIQHLKPNAVILPKNILKDCPQIWDNWPDSIVPFFHTDDLQNQDIARSHGVYFNYTNELLFEQLDKWSHLPRYVTGLIDAILIHNLRIKGIEFIETDEPARAALNGTVYSHARDIDLTNSETKMQFETIDPTCTCPTCSQLLTKAYLHHLLQHTPLLCHRLLIQHNVFWMAFNCSPY